MIDPRSCESLGELLWDATIQFKTDVALIEADRKAETRRFTFREAREAALRVANRLEAAGVGAGDRVAILMSNQSRWLLSAMAAFWRGAVVVPLDYKLTPPEQAALLAHAKPKVLVTEHAIAKRLPADVAPLVLVTDAAGALPRSGSPVGAAPRGRPAPAPNSDLPPGHERWEDTQDRPAEATFVPRSREDVATIVYSSGTGGRPKGCLLPHRAYLAQLDGLLALYPMARGDRWFSILPTNHAIDFLCGFIGPFACGATVVHQRTLRPEMLLWTMQEYGVTHMAVVPLLLAAFERAIREKLDAQPAWKRAAFDALAEVNAAATARSPNPALSRRLLAPVHEALGGKLRVMFCGGAFVERERAEWFYRLGIPVVIGYGLTEACTVVTVGGLSPWRGDSVGQPVPGVRVRVVNPGPDGVGEVRVAGDTVFLGYLDDPDATAEAFDGEWLRTGDLGRLDASDHLHLVGRSKNMVVTTGGKNVYPEDVEGAFAAVPCEEIAVLATDYVWPRRGLVGETLLAVVRPGKDERETLRALRERNRALPDHKRVQGVLVCTEAFPRTASMKLKRHDLAAALRATYDRDAVRPLAPVEA